MTQNANNKDQKIDNVADNALNQGMDDVARRVPEGQKIDQAAEGKVDQVANNAINNEVDKGAGGIIKDAKNLLGGNKA